MDKPTDNPYVDDPTPEFDPVKSLTPNVAETEAQLLREAITYHDHRYYVGADPVISDAAYDRLFDRLDRLERHFDLDTTHSPTTRVGGEPVDDLPTVEHVVPMLSLDSSADEADVREWADRLTDTVPDVTFAVEPKYDGVAVELVYEDGGLDRAVTRGDGVSGDDVTHNIRTIRTIPLTIPQDSPGDLSIRGEIYIPRSGFIALNEERVHRGEEPFANPRNAAAGTIRQLDPNVVENRPLDAYVFDVLQSPTLYGSQADALADLAALGFRVPEDAHVVRTVDEVIAYRDELLARRDEHEAETDGIVVKVNEFAARETLGETARHPRWAFAYKFPAKQGRSTVRRIVVQVGRTGKLTPVALLDPVDVQGVTISRASLHNEQIVNELGVAEGSTVLVERAGDVIPDIAEVENPAPGTFTMPDHCPVCESDVVQDGEHHYCTGGMACPSQLRRNIEHYCGREAQDIEGMGEKLSQQLVERGLVESLADLYDLDKADLVELDALGEQSAENLLEQIEASKRPPLDRFIYALGIRHVGRERARDLATAFSLEGLLDASEADLAAVEGVGPEVARSIRQFLNNPANRDTIDRILAAGVTPESIDTTEELAGLTFVFTGSVEGYSRTELADRLERAGASVTSSVSSRTDYLVVGDNPGATKQAGAEDHDVPMITAAEFIDRFLTQIPA